MRRRSEAGRGNLGLLVLLLLVMGAGGAWNYQKNLAAENAEYRPFRTYTDDELAKLAGAMRSQKDRDAARYDQVAAQRATARERSHFDQRVAEFERVQQVGAKKAAMRAEVAKSATTLKLLAAEERMRAAESNPIKLFFKRLLTI